MLVDRQAFFDGLGEWAETTPLTVSLSDINEFAGH